MVFIYFSTAIAVKVILSGPRSTPFLLAILLFDIDKIVSYSHLFFLYQAIESSKPDCKLNDGTKANSLIALLISQFQLMAASSFNFSRLITEGLFSHPFTFSKKNASDFTKGIGI